MLSWADRTAGRHVGLVAAALVAALLVLPVVAYSPWGASRARRFDVRALYRRGGGGRRHGRAARDGGALPRGGRGHEKDLGRGLAWSTLAWQPV